MTLHQLRVYSVVMKVQGVNAAARRLNLTQPSVSLVLKSLEDSLGVELYKRLRHKHLQPTDAGKVVLQFAEELILRETRLKEEIDEIQGLKKGKLIIGGSGLAGQTFLPQIVARFEKLHPGVEIFLRIEPTDILQEMLADGEVDIAVLALRQDRVTHQGIEVEHYCDEEVVVVAPFTHPLTKRRSVSLKLLLEERFILGKKGDSRIREALEKLLNEKGLSCKQSMEINILPCFQLVLNMLSGNN